MGMYDTVRFECPNCHKYLYEQSKAGKCGCTGYDRKSVPIEIAKSLEDDVISCDGCGKSYKMQIKPPNPMVVKMKLKEIK